MKTNIRIRFARFFRTTTHIGIALSWLLLFGAFVPDLLRTPLFEAPVQPAPTVEQEGPNVSVPVSAIIASVIGAALLIWLVVYAIRRVYVPATDAAVERMTETAQRQVLVTLQKHEPHITKTQKNRINAYTVAVLYTVAIMVPIAVLYIFEPIQNEALALLVKLALLCLATVEIVALLLAILLTKKN